MSNETNVAANANAANEIAKPVELTSPKLVELQTAMQTAWTEMLKHPNPMTTESKNAKIAYLKAESEANAEMLNLQKLENQRKLDEQRNERIQLVTTLLSKFEATIKQPKNATPETIATAASELATAREAVVNQLLAKFAGSKPATSKPDGTATTGRNTDSKAAILEMFHAGKSHAEIEAAGFPKSTVWHTINNYKKANAA